MFLLKNRDYLAGSCGETLFTTSVLPSQWAKEERTAWMGRPSQRRMGTVVHSCLLRGTEAVRAATIIVSVFHGATNTVGEKRER